VLCAILPEVLATPVMILIMENAALNAMRPFLDAGESAVGTAVDVRHFAATPAGRDVRTTTEVVYVEGKRLAKKVATNAAQSALGINDEPRRCAVFCGRLGSAFSGPSTVSA